MIVAPRIPVATAKLPGCNCGTNPPIIPVMEGLAIAVSMMRQTQIVLIKVKTIVSITLWPKFWKNKRSRVSNAVMQTPNNNGTSNNRLRPIAVPFLKF